MNFRRLMLLMMLTLISTGSLHAQWVPVVAKIREVHQTIVDGKVVRSETKEGDYYRSSDGSVLRHWKTVNGDEKAGGRGEFLDNKPGHAGDGPGEGHLCAAAIKLLRQPQDRFRAPVFTVGRSPDRDVNRFLLDLVSNVEDTEEVRVPLGETSNSSPWPFDSKRVPAGINPSSIAITSLFRSARGF